MVILADCLKLSLPIFCILSRIVDHLLIPVDGNDWFQVGVGLVACESSAMTRNFLSLIDNGVQ